MNIPEEEKLKIERHHKGVIIDIWAVGTSSVELMAAIDNLMSDCFSLSESEIAFLQSRISLLESQLNFKQGECDRWKERCRAAEAVMNCFPKDVLQDQAEETYNSWKELKNQNP